MLLNLRPFCHFGFEVVILCNQPVPAFYLSVRCPFGTTRRPITFYISLDELRHKNHVVKEMNGDSFQDSQFRTAVWKLCVFYPSGHFGKLIVLHNLFKSSEWLSTAGTVTLVCLCTLCKSGWDVKGCDTTWFLRRRRDFFWVFTKCDLVLFLDVEQKNKTKQGLINQLKKWINSNYFSLKYKMSPHRTYIYCS